MESKFKPTDIEIMNIQNYTEIRGLDWDLHGILPQEDGGKFFTPF